MQIKVRITKQYGNKRVFPVCEKAELLCMLTGGKTFSDAHVATIKQLGYDIVVVPEVIIL